MNVTGVQACALPICKGAWPSGNFNLEHALVTHATHTGRGRPAENSTKFHAHIRAFGASTTRFPRGICVENSCRLLVPLCLVSLYFVPPFAKGLTLEQTVEELANIVLSWRARIY